MVINRFLGLLVLLLSVLLPVESVACGLQPLDSVFVFKKSAGGVTSLPQKEEKKVVEKKKPKKSNKKRVKKVKVVAPEKRSVGSKSDSLKYVEKKYSLGDRVIMRGDSGADVRKLAEIMVENLYMDENAVPYTKGGKVLYDGELLRAVKLFQKVQGLYADGIVGETTIKKLRKIHRWRR